MPCTFFFGDEAALTTAFGDISEEQSTGNFAYVLNKHTQFNYNQWDEMLQISCNDEDHMNKYY